MEKILISACLVGDKVRYDGHSNYSPLIKDLLEKYELVPFCVEVEGGLGCPRKPSERKGNKVINIDGRDITDKFIEGAKKALMIVDYLGIKIAILKDGSPSCGVTEIHDGNFTNKKIPGKGILTEMLEAKGVTVYSEKQIEELLSK